MSVREDLEKFLDEDQLKWWRNLQLTKANFAAAVFTRQGHWDANRVSPKRRAYLRKKTKASRKAARHGRQRSR